MIRLFFYVEGQTEHRAGVRGAGTQRAPGGLWRDGPGSDFGVHWQEAS